MTVAVKKDSDSNTIAKPATPPKVKTASTKKPAAKKTASKAAKRPSASKTTPKTTVTTVTTAKTVAKSEETKTPDVASTQNPQTAPLGAPVEALKIPAKAAALTPAVISDEMRKEHLLDEVAKRSGAKRKDVKPIVEAMLEVLGEALGEARDVNLKPLGKIKVARTKQVANGRVIQLRLRQSDMVIKELEDKAEAAE